MKIVIVVRHAKAVWTNSDSADFQRNLDPQGVIDAEKMGQLLFQEGIIPDTVLCSPALRASKTTEILIDNLHLPPTTIERKEKLYNASSETILSIIQSLKNAKILMIVGHNPGVSDFVSLVTDGSQVSMGTCDVAIIGFEVDHWQDCRPGTGYLSRYIESY